MANKKLGDKQYIYPNREGTVTLGTLAEGMQAAEFYLEKHGELDGFHVWEVQDVREVKLALREKVVEV